MSTASQLALRARATARALAVLDLIDRGGRLDLDDDAELVAHDQHGVPVEVTWGSMCHCLRLGWIDWGSGNNIATLEPTEAGRIELSKNGSRRPP